MMSTAELQDAIAIIGMSGRFPGARNIEEFWQNLCAGAESITFFSDEELLASGIDPAIFTQPQYVRAKGVLSDIELFDAGFFGFSPREAELLDPQQRLFLECAWEALEDAAYDPGIFEGLIGVYAGSGMSTYIHNLYANPHLMSMVGSFQVMIGNDKDHVSTHVSYKFNLRGPSVAIQTACSTSLVATCMACQGLLNYQCDLALAGGVLISVPQAAGYLYQEGGIMSPDGHCRPFDTAAQGTVEGNGVGIVVLRRLDEAIAAGDQIYAIIRGSAVNNDGSLKVGYTAPGIAGQAEVITMAHASADVDPATISYVEAHGTATPLGDPIEIAALTRAFRTGTERTDFCAIGSVKGNIGHLDPAAGVAGLIKTALALKHKLLPPSLHFRQPNERIDFASSPFYVNTTLMEWPADTAPRRAGVSSFGIGGTNAHVVLEEALSDVPAAPSRPYQLYVLSAQTDAALEMAVANLATYLRRHPDLNPADVAYTLQVGRKPFGRRRALVAQSLADTTCALEAHGYPALPELRERPVAFMFPGGGAQYPGMARDLYESEPVFREHVDRCCALLRPHLGLDLRDTLHPALADKDSRELTRPLIALPALFAVEYALAQLLMSWGIRPHALIGHSLGECVAAALAGVFSLDDALLLVVQRARLLEQLPSGAMLSVALDETALRPLLDERLSIAATNAPSQCVVAGPVDAIEPLAAILDARQIDFQRLHIDVAAHSQLVDAILPQFGAVVERLPLGPPAIPIISNVTGRWVTAEEMTTPGYWIQHLRETVRFAEGVQHLLAQPDWILLEVGPGRALSTLVRQQPAWTPERSVLPCIRHPQEQKSDVAFLLNTLGQLWSLGAPVDWAAFHAHERRRRLSLPTYPFERQRFWIDPPLRSTGLAARRLAPARSAAPASCLYEPAWRRTPIRSEPEPSAHASECWLLFSDDLGLGEQLGRRLKHSGDVISVKIGSRFGCQGEQTYTLDPRQPDDYTALLGDLRARGTCPSAVLHLWSIAPPAPNPLTSEFFAQQQDRGFYSLVWLMQAYERANVPLPQQLLVASCGVQEVIGDERLCPERATILGPCHVIPQEYPGVVCRSIDIDTPPAGSSPDGWLIEQLFTEVMSDSGERVVAYRRQHRWAQTFEPLRAGDRSSRTQRLREGGVYMITGGLGRIGITLAGYLARTIRARLVLVSRAALPPLGEWEQRLQGPESDLSRTIRRLRAMEADGAQVLVVSADVTDRAQLRMAVERARQRFGGLHGVIHTAGVTGEEGFSLLRALDRATCELQFGPKVRGTLALEEALRDQEVDFVLLCSSLSSVLGGIGFAAYAAANLFLDALAQHKGMHGPARWQSINWEGWRFDEPRATPGGSSLLDLALSPEEGAEVFHQIMSMRPAPQILVSTSDLRTRVDNWIATHPTPEQAQPQGAAQSHPRPALRSTYVAPRNELERLIAAVWQEMLGVDPIGVDDNFFELGGHSLVAIHLMARLSTTCQVKVPLHHLFEAPTVAQLALAIEDMLMAEIEALSDVEAERLLKGED